MQEQSAKAQLESAQKHLQSAQDQLSVALKENHILKRAVAIQHERQREHESQAQELLALRQSVGQYQEQLRKLEVRQHAASLTALNTFPLYSFLGGAMCLWQEFRQDLTYAGCSI